MSKGWFEKSKEFCIDCPDEVGADVKSSISSFITCFMRKLGQLVKWKEDGTIRCIEKDGEEVLEFDILQNITVDGCDAPTVQPTLTVDQSVRDKFTGPQGPAGEDGADAINPTYKGSAEVALTVNRPTTETLPAGCEPEPTYCDAEGKVANIKHYDFTASSAEGEIPTLSIDGANEGTYDIANLSGTFVEGEVLREVSNPSACLAASICIETELSNYVEASAGAPTSVRSNHAAFLEDPSGNSPTQVCFLGSVYATVTNSITLDSVPPEVIGLSQAETGELTGKTCFSLPAGATGWILKFAYNMEQLSVSRSNASVPNANHPDATNNGVPPKYDMNTNLKYKFNVSTKRILAGTVC